MCSQGYFNKHPSLNEAMRKILIDWLVDVHRKFKLRPTTLFMAVNIVDRFMELTSDFIHKSKYQLFGITCLFIAAKYEEIYPPGLGDFVYVCADTYNAHNILDMEGIILNTLEFNLVYSSSLQLFGIYAEESMADTYHRANRGERASFGDLPSVFKLDELWNKHHF
jgi:cyclin B